MREVPFSIPISGVVRINEESVTIVVNKAETIISLSPEAVPGKRLSLKPGRTMYDIILETAREVVRIKEFNRFSAPELYAVASEEYPELKRNSFMARVIACTPNHSSYKHHTSKRDYFSHIGPGFFKLNEQYGVDETVDRERNIFNP